MKTITESFRDHLAGELSTLAECVKLTRTDGQVIAFTSHDRDLTIQGTTYRADGGFSGGKLVQEGLLKAKNYEVSGILDSSLIDEADLKAGLYDHARIDVYLCNWADLSQGVLQVRRGWIGEVAISGGQYIANLRGFHDLLTRKVGETYTPECRYDLGDGRCGVNAQSYAVSGSVTGVIDERSFTDAARAQDTGTFNDGKLTWVTGANAGLSCEVNSWTLATKVMTLWLPLPRAIEVGDAYQVTAGCDKRFSTCKARFNNGANYGGFPYLPGIGKILQYPD